MLTTLKISHPALRRCLWILGSLLLALGGTACQKKCGTPVTEAYRSLGATEWRVVESTSPQFKKSLTKYTFLIFKFNPDFTGEVYSVINNQRMDTPELTFKWKASNGSLQMLYTSTAELASQGLESEEDTSAPATTTYSYKLGRDLQLNEKGTNYYHRFVAFDDIIAPDDNCTF